MRVTTYVILLLTAVLLLGADGPKDVKRSGVMG